MINNQSILFIIRFIDSPRRRPLLLFVGRDEFQKWAVAAAAA